jgi:hypothetical protein
LLSFCPEPNRMDSEKASSFLKAGILFCNLCCFDFWLFLTKLIFHLFLKSHSSFKERDPPILTRFEKENSPFLTKKQEIKDKTGNESN